LGLSLLVHNLIPPIITRQIRLFQITLIFACSLIGISVCEKKAVQTAAAEDEEDRGNKDCEGWELGESVSRILRVEV
jgi:hypothetical protein